MGDLTNDVQLRRFAGYSIFFATIVGGLLRAYSLGSQGLSHFDEGIYAISGLWPWTHQFEASQGYFSPPLFPLLIGILELIYGGPSEQACLQVSWFFGTLTIPAVWLLLRELHFQRGSIVAAWVIAVDPFHATFSRTGLTDSLFCCLLVLSLFASIRALARGGKWQICLACLLIGFTWNTKYHGFYPLILSAPFALNLGWRHGLRRLAIIGVGSFVLYLPWIIWFHVEHGYGNLIKHQAGYFQGLAALPSNLRVWCLLHGTFDWRWVLGILVAAYAVLPGATGLARSAVLFLIGFGLENCFHGRPELSFPLFFIIAVIAALTNSRTKLSAVQHLWILIWLTFLPALYTPYARLWLPADVLVLAFAGAGAWQYLPELANRRSDNLLSWWPNRLFGRVPVSILVAGAGVVLAWNVLPQQRGALGQQRDWLVGKAGYREIAKQLKLTSQDGRIPVAAYCRPPLIFYSALNGYSIRRLAQARPDQLPIAENELLVVDGMIVDSKEIEQSLKAWTPYLEVVNRWKLEPSIVTELDDTATGRLKDVDPRRYDVTVYRRKLK